MANSYSNKEDRIVDAINAWDTGEFRSIRAAAIDFDVDVRTLQRRLAGGGSRIGRTPPNKALSDEQELAIYDYIRMLDQAEQSARFPMVRGAANYLLREAHLDAFTPPPHRQQFLDQTFPQSQSSVLQTKTKTFGGRAKTRAQCKGHT